MDEPERPRNPKPFWFMIPYLLVGLAWTILCSVILYMLYYQTHNYSPAKDEIEFSEFTSTPLAFGLPMFVAGVLFYFGGKTRRNLMRVRWVQALALLAHSTPFLFAIYKITPGPRGDFGGGSEVGISLIMATVVCVPHFCFCLLMFLTLWTKAVKDRYIGYEIDKPTPDTAS